MLFQISRNVGAFNSIVTSLPQVPRGTHSSAHHRLIQQRPLCQEIIPIDGKSLRGSYDREKGLKNLHLVTAWASGQRLVLGQVKVEDHSNEITAIPALLELLDIAGAIITIDAMGTQTEIVRLIRQKKADYVVGSIPILQVYKSMIEYMVFWENRHLASPKNMF